MNNPEKQHFLPKSYLKNFANVQGNKAFVEVMNVKSGQIIYPVSTKKICFSKDIYTLPDVDDNNKYFLEHFYANNIDGVYPEVYRMLTDPRFITITEDQRDKILHTCLSFYFRNIRFLNDKNDKLDSLIDRFTANTESSDSAKIFIQFGGRQYNFHKGEIDYIRKKAMVDNRMDFILEHVQDWKNFVGFKNSSQITVCKILGDVKLITSDNPVRIEGDQNRTFNLFDPRNSIQLPLDQEHLLWISPNEKDVDRNKIYHQVRDKWFALTSNYIMSQDASEWIISKKGFIKMYLHEEKMYNNTKPENMQAVVDIKIKAHELTKFVELAQATGSITSEECLQRLRVMKNIPSLAADPEFKITLIQVAALGYKI